MSSDNISVIPETSTRTSMRSISPRLRGKRGNIYSEPCYIYGDKISSVYRYKQQQTLPCIIEELSENTPKQLFMLHNIEILNKETNIPHLDEEQDEPNIIPNKSQFEPIKVSSSVYVAISNALLNQDNPSIPENQRFQDEKFEEVD